MRIMVGRWESPKVIRVVAVCEGWQATLKLAREVRASGFMPAFGIGPFKFTNRRGHRKFRDWTTTTKS